MTRAARPRPNGTDLAGLSRLCTLATALGLVLLALLRVGRRLPTPPLDVAAGRSSEVWSSWFTRVGPAGATMSVVRVLALILAAYLLALVAIEVVGRAVGLPRLLSLGHLVSTPMARRLIRGAAGVGVALSLTAASVGPASATSVDVTAPPSATAPTTSDTTMTSLDAAPPVMRATDPSPTSLAPVVPVAPADDQWVIRGGDHLWGVARRTLAGAWHRAPTDAETARYLDDLIETNLEVLVVPGDADLVLAGQVFRLPPVPAA